MTNTVPDKGLRARVERLLGGDYRTDDLTRLFLYARDRCDGREAVQEIGDFVAHHSERTKGIITRGTRDWFAIAKFIPIMVDKKIDGAHLPPYFPAFLHATFRRIEPRRVKETAKLRYADAYRLLPSLIQKLSKNQDGTLAISPSHTVTELALMRCLTTVIISKPAFDNDRLFSDFSATLKSQSLLKKEELKSFESLKPAIGLFAATLMHNCAIDLGDGTFSMLKAQPFVPNGTINVIAAVPVALPAVAGSVTLATPIFATDLVSEQHCEASLLGEKQPWECDIEVNANRMLAKLG